jgi:hypothetical protein
MVMALVIFLGSVPAQSKPDEMPWVQVAQDKNRLVLDSSGLRGSRRFVKRLGSELDKDV